MKKLFTIFAILFCGIAHSAQIVNVEYIHNAIQQKWDITVPYNSELSNPRVAANMKYLLTAVDVANEMLNGDKTTDYGNGEYATLVAADTVATDTAVENLISKNIEYKFFMTTTDDTSSFSLSLGAAGTFYIDWGDGTTEIIEKNDYYETTHTHNYANTGIYNIKLGGQATAYQRCTSATSSIGPLNHSTNGGVITDISGCLGCIFPTLDDGSQPCFPRLFAWTYIQNIPDNLFDGITENFTDYMFFAMFQCCPYLTGDSAKINGKYIYEIQPVGIYQIGAMYYLSNKLNDYNNMPEVCKVNPGEFG